MKNRAHEPESKISVERISIEERRIVVIKKATLLTEISDEHSYFLGLVEPQALIVINSEGEHLFPLSENASDPEDSLDKPCR